MKILQSAICSLVLLVATSVSAQTSLLGDETRPEPGTVRAERAAYGPKMTPADVGRMLNAIAWKNRASGWGLLSKNFGTNCPAIGTIIACDILVHAPSGQHFDVLVDAENAARPTWDNKGPIDMSRFLAPVDPGPTAPGTSTPPATTGGADLAPVLARLATIEHTIAALEATVPSLEQRVDAATRSADAAGLAVGPIPAQINAIAGDLADLAARLAALTCSAALNLGATRVPISCRVTIQAPATR